MSQKTIRIFEWITVIILGLLFAFSAFLKLTQNEAALAQAASMGIDGSTYRLIGIVEIISLILFLIPRTGFIGSLLLIAYMGGAIASHLQHQQPIAVAVVVEILIWVSLALRYPVLLRQLIPGIPKARHKQSFTAAKEDALSRQ